MATLFDVAKAAGVSTATASRALAGSSAVAERTAKRVLSAAEALSYTVNPTARALASGCSGLIGVCVPWLGNPLYVPLLKACQDAALSVGAEIVVADSSGDPSREHAVLDRLASRVDGILAVSSSLSDDAIRQRAASIPLVSLRRAVPGVASVTVDLAPALRGISERIRAAHCTRIAYVGGPPGSRVDEQRFHLVASMMKRSGASVHHAGQFSPTVFRGRDAYEAVRGLSVDAAIVYSSLLAAGVQLVTPVRCSLAGGLYALDDLAAAESGEPALVMVRQQPAEMAREAIAMVRQQSRHPERRAHVEVASGLLAPRTEVPRED